MQARAPVLIDYEAVVAPSLRDFLCMWVVTARPADYPAGYVARLSVVRCGQTAPLSGPTTKALFAPSLDALRLALLCQNPGLTNLGRYAQDDPVIVEVWF